MPIAPVPPLSMLTLLDPLSLFGGRDEQQAAAKQVAMRTSVAPGAGQVAAQGFAETETPAQTPAPAPLTPEAETRAIVGALQARAAPAQDGLAPLMADLAAVVDAPALPPQVAAAARQVLARQVPLEPPPDAHVLRQALAGSGLLLEARLAVAGAPPPGDLKAALLTLQSLLKAWEETAPPAPLLAAGAYAEPATEHDVSSRPPPPYRDAPPHGQPPARPGLRAEAEPGPMREVLVRETRAALARQSLQQAASLPAGADPHLNETAPPRWVFEMPLATPYGCAVAQFEIARDGGGGGAAGPASAPAHWRTRFSLDLEPLGPVQAEVLLAAGRTRVTLWAEREATAARLRAGVEGLAGRLDHAEVAVLTGAPRQTAPAPGRLVEREA